MGNICCGSREDAKIKTSTLKEALRAEAKMLLPQDLQQTEAIEAENPSSQTGIHHETNKVVVNEEEKAFSDDNIDEKSETLKIIEKVLEGKTIIESIQKKLKQSVLKNIQTNGSKYNEKELQIDTIKGTLLVIDQELIIKQRGVIGHILKKFSLNLLQGKSLMNISFPVQIFESRSVLQRLASTFAYAPNFIERAGESNDDLEQFKLVLSFMISGLHLNISQRKPFNPILGETYEGFIGKSPVYLEQISHHPPISYFQVS